MHCFGTLLPNYAANYELRFRVKFYVANHAVLVPHFNPLKCGWCSKIIFMRSEHELFITNILTITLVSVLTQLHNTFTQNNGLETPSVNIQKYKKHAKMHPSLIKT